MRPRKHKLQSSYNFMLSLFLCISFYIRPHHPEQYNLGNSVRVWHAKPVIENTSKTETFDSPSAVRTLTDTFMNAKDTSDATTRGRPALFLTRARIIMWPWLLTASKKFTKTMLGRNREGEAV